MTQSVLYCGPDEASSLGLDAAQIYWSMLETLKAGRGARGMHVAQMKVSSVLRRGEGCSLLRRSDGERSRGGPRLFGFEGIDEEINAGGGII